MCLLKLNLKMKTRIISSQFSGRTTVYYSVLQSRPSYQVTHWNMSIIICENKQAVKNIAYNLAAISKFFIWKVPTSVTFLVTQTDMKLVQQH
uniref:Uncharacterized protein n=1 Tax=Arundo donax TaxID=35708 RepID=A0A0A9DFX6_ARUDO